MKKLIKIYNEESDADYFLEVDVQYPKKLHEIHNDLPILWEIMKIKKVERFVVNLYDKTECYRHKKFKTSIKSWMDFEKGS